MANRFGGRVINSKITGLVAALVIFGGGLLVSGSEALANIVQNPGFETGDFTDWTTDYPYARWNVTNGQYGITPYAGQWYAATGCIGLFCNLSQDLTTTPNTTYDVSFAFNPGRNANGGNGETQVFWNGILVKDLVGGDLGWTVYTLPGLLATSSSTTLLFTGFQVPATNGLDFVSVDAASVVTPLPASWIQLLLGLAVFGFAAYRGTSARGRLIFCYPPTY